MSVDTGAREPQLAEFLRPGVAWVNKHTGDETTLTSFASRVERIPDPAGGFKDDPQLVVHHTVNVPPGFTEGYGDDLRSFLEHWQPKDAALAAGAAPDARDEALKQIVAVTGTSTEANLIARSALAAGVGVPPHKDSEREVLLVSALRAREHLREFENVQGEPLDEIAAVAVSAYGFAKHRADSLERERDELCKKLRSSYAYREVQEGLPPGTLTGKLDDDG